MRRKRLFINLFPAGVLKRNSIVEAKKGFALRYAKYVIWSPQHWRFYRCLWYHTATFFTVCINMLLAEFYGSYRRLPSFLPVEL